MRKICNRLKAKFYKVKETATTNLKFIDQDKLIETKLYVLKIMTRDIYCIEMD